MLEEIDGPLLDFKEVRSGRLSSVAGRPEAVDASHRSSGRGAARATPTTRVRLLHTHVKVAAEILVMLMVAGGRAYRHAHAAAGPC